MGAQQKGLGRGLDALFGSNDLELDVKATNTAETPTGIELDEIDPNYEQPRKIFDADSLKELSDSIKQHGVIQPIIVTKIGRRYMIIAGERRFRAAKLAGLTNIPAIVRNYTPQQIREISLVENLQRDDLNAIEAARAIKELMENFNLTQESVADRLGKSRPAIANTLRLLSLCDKVISLIEQGKLSSGHGRALVVIDDETAQFNLAQKVIANKWSVRETEKAVRDLLNPKVNVAVPKPPISIELKDLVGNMTRAFATKVSAIGNDNKGRIYIDYYTKDDLDRICMLIDGWVKEHE